MAWLQYDFMQRALVAGLLVGVVGPLIGVFLVLRRYAQMADTLSHVSLAGLAGGAVLGLSPTFGATGAAVAAALGMERLRRSGRLYGETVLALFISGALAGAVILMHYGAGMGTDLLGYLLGSILTVTDGDLAIMALVSLLDLLALLLLWKELFAISLDEEAARITGVRTSLASYVFAAVTALAVAISIRAVGVLLVSALMVIPAASSFQVARSFRQACILSVAFGLIGVVAGLVTAFYVGWPAGPAIVLVLVAVFVGTLGWARNR